MDTSWSSVATTSAELPMVLHLTQLSTALLCLRQRQLLQLLRHHQHRHQLQDLLTTVHHLASLTRPPMSSSTSPVLTLVRSAMPSAPLIPTAQPTLLVALRSRDASSKIRTLVTRHAVWSVASWVESALMAPLAAASWSVCATGLVPLQMASS